MRRVKNRLATSLGIILTFCICLSPMKPIPAYADSEDMNTSKIAVYDTDSSGEISKGDIIDIGGERFYVTNFDETNVSGFALRGLSISDNMQSDNPDRVRFSDSSYTYFSRSEVIKYVQAYGERLNSKYGLEAGFSLPGTGDIGYVAPYAYSGDIYGDRPWYQNGNYWTSSTYRDYGAWKVSGNKLQAVPGNTSTAMVRPTITLAKTKIDEIKEHNLVKHDAVTATCTASGNYEYYTCDVEGCGKVFKADKITETTFEEEIIPESGHTIIHHDAAAATCVKEGSVEYWSCSACGEKYSDATGTTVISNIATPVDTSNHVNTEVRNKKAATEESSGYTGDTYCNDCCVKLESGEIIPKLTHEPEESKVDWDKVKEEIGNIREGGKIIVDMKETTTIKGDIIDSIKGRNIDVVFDFGCGIKWTVNGKDVSGDNIQDINLGVKTNTRNIPVDVINSITGHKSIIQISLIHNGEFGFTATLSIGLDAGNAGYYANLFYYKASAKELEFMNASKIDADGNATLTFTHASDYSIVIADKIMDGIADNKPADTPTIPDAGKSTDTPTTPDANRSTDTPTAPDADRPDTASAETSDNTLFVWLFIPAIMSGIGLILISIKEKSAR